MPTFSIVTRSFGKDSRPFTARRTINRAGSVAIANTGSAQAIEKLRQEKDQAIKIYEAQHYKEQKDREKAIIERVEEKAQNAERWTKKVLQVAMVLVIVGFSAFCIILTVWDNLLGPNALWIKIVLGILAVFGVIDLIKSFANNAQSVINRVAHKIFCHVHAREVKKIKKYQL